MCGFADIESLVSSAPKPSARAVVRGRISRALFRREGHLIVEAPTVRAELVSRWGIAAEAIRVVPNVVNAIFTCPADWAPLDVRTPEGVPVLGYVARAYPHKNHNFLGELGEELDALGSSVKFLLTLTETEWIELSDNTRRHSINVGPVAVPQLPAFYASCNAVVFPSLNEAFSATPLETMATRRPLFASDRRFVRDVAGDAATYFDPLDPRQAADVISRGLKDKGRLEDGIRSGSELVDAWPTAAGRAHSYLDAIDLALKGVAR